MSRGRRALLALPLLLVLGPVWGITGTVVAATVVSLIGGWVLVTRSDGFDPYRRIGLSSLGFVVGHMVAQDVVALPSWVGQAGLDFAYLMVVLAVWQLFSARLGGLDGESTTEAAGVALVVTVVSRHLGWWASGEVSLSDLVLDGAAFVTTFAVAAVVMGRNGRLLREWALAAGIAVLSETFDSTLEAVSPRLANWLLASSAVGFVILANQLLRERELPEGERVPLLAPDPMPPRRKIGRVQQLLVLLSLVAPLIFIVQAAGAADYAHVAMLACAEMVLVGIIWLRVSVTIERRDEALASETRIRHLGQQLVACRTEGDVLEAVRLAAVDLASEHAAALILRRRADGTVESLGEQASLPARTEPLLVVDGTEWSGDEIAHDIVERHLRAQGPRSSSRFDSMASPSFATAVACTPHAPDGAEVLVIALFAGSPFETGPAQLSVGLKSALRTTVVQLRLALEMVELREASHTERANHRFGALVRNSIDIAFVVEPETWVVNFVSPTIHKLLGRRSSDVIGLAMGELVNQDDRESLHDALRDVGRADRAEVDIRVQHLDGYYRWFGLSVQDLSDDPEIAGLVINLTDLHERKLAEMQLRSSEERHRRMVMNSSEVFAVLDDENTIIDVTPNITGILGFQPSDLIGTKGRHTLTDGGGQEFRRFMKNAGTNLDGGVLEVEMFHQSGDVRKVEVRITQDETLGGNFMVTLRDVTTRRELEASLRDRALVDGVTGLANRTSFSHELQSRLQTLNDSNKLGIAHLDVDSFKTVNETLGLAAGDRLLRDIANRLRARLRPGDLIARIGADEFAVVLVSSADGDLELLARRLIEAFDKPFMIGNEPQQFSASVGMAVTADRRCDIRWLLENAALALSSGRESQRPGSFVVYQDELRRRAADRYEISRDIPRGLSNEEFSLVYQPVLDLDTQMVKSVEALMRWDHRKRGRISPAEFIPLAEKSGAIIELGRWVLRTACEQLQTWQRELPGASGLSIAVNVSARQLERDGESQVLMDIISATGIDPRRLTIELTESTMLDDSVSTREQLEAFRSTGVRVAVDDFGTGAAGLNHLRDIPFDVVKIDRSYIDKIETSEDARQLIGAVIGMSHRLGATVVAEGIEDPVQAVMLRDLDCDLGQGYYLGRPMEVDKIEAWFEQGRQGDVPALIDPTPNRAAVPPGR